MKQADLYSLSVWDYVVFVITIVLCLGIGLYHAVSGGKQRTTSEYFVGDRKMSVLPVALSLMVTFESSILMIGTPAEVYVYGIQIIMETLGWFLSYVITLSMAVALIHPLKLTSTYEYLQLRFRSRYVRTLGTVLGILYYVAYLGIVLFGPAIALEAVCGVPLWISIICVAGSAMFYTTLGGFKAVVWTDVLQTVIMFSGLAAILIQGTLVIGGVQKTWITAEANGRLNFFDFRADPTIRHTFWCLTLNGLFRSFGLLVNQSSVQRISSMPTQKDALKLLIITAPAFLLTLSLACVEGIVAYSYFHSQGCDPLESGAVRDPNQIIPYMVLDMFRNQKGMLGLFMASLFSASLSTLSSGLSSMSLLVVEDFVKPIFHNLSEPRATLVAKLAVVGFGLLAIAIAFLTSLIGGTLVQIAVSILASFHGPLAGMFMFGAFCPWANSKGVFTGTITACAFSLWLCIGQMTTEGAGSAPPLPPAPVDFCTGNTSFITTHEVTTVDFVESTAMAAVEENKFSGLEQLYTMSYQWFSTIGIAAVFIVGSVVSVLTGVNKTMQGDEKYFIPVFDHLFGYLPLYVLKRLRCGVKYGPDKRVKQQSASNDVDSIPLKSDYKRNL